MRGPWRRYVFDRSGVVSLGDLVAGASQRQGLEKLKRGFSAMAR